MEVSEYPSMGGGVHQHHLLEGASWHDAFKQGPSHDDQNGFNINGIRKDRATLGDRKIHSCLELGP
eukprot:6472570-Alexandrium_andersonii.AAC.1